MWVLAEFDADIFGHKFIAAIKRWMDAGVPAGHIRADWDGRLYSIWIWQGDEEPGLFPGDDEVKDADDLE